MFSRVVRLTLKAQKRPPSWLLYQQWLTDATSSYKPGYPSRPLPYRARQWSALPRPLSTDELPGLQGRRESVSPEHEATGSEKTPPPLPAPPPHYPARHSP